MTTMLLAISLASNMSLLFDCLITQSPHCFQRLDFFVAVQIILHGYLGLINSKYARTFYLFSNAEFCFLLVSVAQYHSTD